MCIFCEEKDEYAHLQIGTRRFWNVALHTDQAYLGRMIFYAKRHEEDYAKIQMYELEELQRLRRNASEALKKLGSSRINYCVLGNCDPHVHEHVIPRYEHSIEFAGETFVDERWGKNYAPYTPRILTKEQYGTLVAFLQKEMFPSKNA